MLPVVLDSDYRKKAGTDIDYKPYQFLPFKRIFDKTENGFALKKKEGNLLIINDDNGIGLKTEAGIIVSQLLANNPGLRILILTYSQNLSVWKENMYEHFGLDFQIYDNDNCNSDLLIVDLDDNNNNFGEFDVQIVCNVNYYGEDRINEFKEMLSNEYLLRVLIHSDELIDQKDDNTPYTSASTVSSFNISKSVEECEDDKTEHLKNYLNQIDGYFRAVIFTNSDQTVDNLANGLKDEGFEIHSIKKIMLPDKKDNSKANNLKRISEANKFRKTDAGKSLLICSYPYGFDLSFCRTAIHYNISQKKYEVKESGLICKADRKVDVNIVYFVDNDDDKEKADAYISEHNEKLKTKEQDLKQIEAEVEEYLSTVNGSENADDKKRLMELKGEKQ